MKKEISQHNRHYKDRLFRLLFGSMEMKDNIISLYNALNGTGYTVNDDLQIVTLEDAIYIRMKNDVAILINSCLSLWEQQSTINPNMPLRGLMYFGNMYEAYIEQNELNIYGHTLVRVPLPKYIVFYNGREEVEAVQKLKLSDAFMHPDRKKEFEWTATVLNLNAGKNDDLLKKCKPLEDYMSFINYIHENQKHGKTIETAVDEAVLRCMNEGRMEEYLRKHRAEVMDVCLTEFNEKVFVKGIREEGRIEGIQEGRKEGSLSMIQAIQEYRRGSSYDQLLEKYGEDIAKAAIMIG